MNLKSLYICVQDMNRAIEFYEELLGQTVTEKDDIYSVFDINGFRLGLFAYEKKGESHEYGSNCLPSLSVDSKAILEKKIMGKEICQLCKDNRKFYAR